MILNDLLRGAGQSQAYDRLAAFVDESGNRFTGTDSLEQAIGKAIESIVFTN